MSSRLPTTGRPWALKMRGYSSPSTCTTMLPLSRRPTKRTFLVRPAMPSGLVKSIDISELLSLHAVLETFGDAVFEVIVDAPRGAVRGVAVAGPAAAEHPLEGWGPVTDAEHASGVGLPVRGVEKQ